MIKYKLSYLLPPTEDGKELKFMLISENFEIIIHSVIKNLQSIWKGTLPLPSHSSIEIAKEMDEEGLYLMENGDNIAYNSNCDVSSFLITEALELSNQTRKKRIPNETIEMIKKINEGLRK